jgi:hypothetical protein
MWLQKARDGKPDCRIAYFDICTADDTFLIFSMIATVYQRINNIYRGSVGGSGAAINPSVFLGKFGICSTHDGTYIDPANLPSPGTKVLSTTEGSGPLTTPPGGATMTVTLNTNTYTITAAT